MQRADPIAGALGGIDRELGDCRIEGGRLGGPKVQRWRQRFVNAVQDAVGMAGQDLAFDGDLDPVDRPFGVEHGHCVTEAVATGAQSRITIDVDPP
ncbi:hypothetical protein [Sphingomonas sp. H160509]|uniref:hypothetical protein n=1 Tax=Sphingomonas sp. H160509 TaxID=2955313 RepID=UPI0031584E7F